MKYIPLLICLTLPNISFADNWPATIARVKERVETLAAHGLQIGIPNPGNHSLKQIGELHKCAILGRIHGEVAAIAPLEQITVPDLTAQSSDDVKLAYAEGIKSLDVWISVAEFITVESKSFQGFTWNEFCTGKSFVLEDGSLYTIPAGLIKSETN